MNLVCFGAPVVFKLNWSPAFSILTSSSNLFCLPRYSSEVKYIYLLFIVLQDLRPLYAGRCAYHSSETASDRDVRNTHFTSQNR